MMQSPMGVRAVDTDDGQRLLTAGRDARGRFSRLPLMVHITARGHWFRSDDAPNGNNDTVCRGCGASGHFAYILDAVECTAAMTDEQLAEILPAAAARTVAA